MGEELERGVVDDCEVYYELGDLECRHVLFPPETAASCCAVVVVVCAHWLALREEGMGGRTHDNVHAEIEGDHCPRLWIYC